nr:hypothetical protein [Tanacetum cinerariifolium]
MSLVVKIAKAHTRIFSVNRGPHETFQCQPTNEDYCYEQNSFGTDHCQPPQYTVDHPIFDAQNELLTSQNKLMEQMTQLTSMGPHETFHCQPPQYTVNHPIFNTHNDLLSSQTTLMEQTTTLTSMYEMVCQIVQTKQEEKQIEEEQAANARYWKISACCDDDDDYKQSHPFYPPKNPLTL